jgi:hypothetical protein
MRLYKMGIKNFLLVGLIILSMALPIEAFGGSLQFKPGSEADNFRSIKWGTDISTLKDMECMETEDGLLKVDAGGEVMAEKPFWEIFIRSAGGVTLLGVRDKYGASGSFTAEFVVTAADGKSARVRKNGRGSEWCEVNFPDDFNWPAANATGSFSYKILANGKVIGVGTFEYRRTTSRYSA